MMGRRSRVDTKYGTETDRQITELASKKSMCRNEKKKKQHTLN